jgi:Mrp family chromosome partitioning ATPase
MAEDRPRVGRTLPPTQDQPDPRAAESKASVSSASVSSLVIGERIVSRCNDGLLEAEYALFDRSEVLVAPGAEEEGYMTTAALGRARLYGAHVTADLAYEAFGAMRARHLRPLARSSAVRDVVDQLGPYEAFQGGRFVARRGRYAGVWLDLDALAAECPLRDASVLFQALHLVLVLEEIAEETPVRLLTRQTRSESGTGGRTWRRVDLGPAQRLPSVLREMQAPTRSHDAVHDEAEVREGILRDLRARATSTSIVQPRLNTLAAAIARTGRSTRPDRGVGASPLPPAMPRSSPRPPSGPPAPKIPRPAPIPRPPVVDAAPEPQTDTPSRGVEQLRSVAQSLAALAERSPFVPNLAILTARAWLAAGEPGLARHFAGLVVDDASATDDLRVMALEILDTAPRAHATTRPPPASSEAPAEAVVPSPAQALSVRAPPTALAVRSAKSAPPVGHAPFEEQIALDPRLVLLSEPDSQRSASFRLLRDNLLAKKAPRIIAVSSGAAHEGKTTCAINLALALSEKPSTRVLLMEGNFFAPSLAEIFHIDPATSPDPVMNLPVLAPYRIVRMMRGFHVAALVQHEGEPPPTFNSRWFDMVIDHLSGAGYDFLVIDAAALDGSPAVTQVLGVADGTLLTARSRTTTARNLRRAAEQIPEGRALGVTLMDSDS